MKSHVFTASWVLLLVLAIAVALLSLNSARVAFSGNADPLASGVTVEQVGVRLSPEVATAIRARRVTAATWALGYALLMVCLVLVPYRRGERWTWWALLLSLGVSQLVSIVRILALETVQGTGASTILLVILGLGLLLGAPRMFGRPKEPPVTVH